MWNKIFLITIIMGVSSLSHSVEKIHDRSTKKVQFEVRLVDALYEYSFRPGSSYIIETDDPALIREARARVKKNQRRIAAGLSPYDDIDRKLVGALGVVGNSGANYDRWSWEITSWQFADASHFFCNILPEDIERDINEGLITEGTSFCISPWESMIFKEI